MRYSITESLGDAYQSEDFEGEPKEIIALLNATSEKKKINLNDTVKVRLTQKGIDVLMQNNETLNEKIKSLGGKPRQFYSPHLDDEGYFKTQLWALMQDFGPHLGVSKPLVFETEIILCD